jgi:H+/Cl- antiporter ClcA
MAEAIPRTLRVIRFDLQGYLKPFLYGLLGGLAAVAFQLGIKLIEWGGAGVIFSPTLFFGAKAGFLFGTVCTPIFHLTQSDRLALTMPGMSACLGAVVRAPITSILIVFEMTHQFAFVPLLMIGTIASQATSHLLCSKNFYVCRASSRIPFKGSPQAT